MKNKSKKNQETYNIPDLDFVDLDLGELDGISEDGEDRAVSEAPSPEDYFDEDDFPEETSQADVPLQEDFPVEDFPEGTSQEDAPSQDDFPEETSQEDTPLQEDFPVDEFPESDFPEETQQDDFQQENFPQENFSPQNDFSVDDFPQDASPDTLPEIAFPQEEVEEKPDREVTKKHIPSVFIHIGFVAALAVIVLLVGWRILNYGSIKNLDDYEGDYSPETYDNILPLFPEDGVEPEDDGVTTIVAFGNAPFADDRNSPDGLANLIEDMTGATVYNCAVGDSYLAADGATLSSEIAPMDAFNFYWLTTAFCIRNNAMVYQNIFDVLGEDAPADGIEAYETLMGLDFNKVDVVVIMYDGSDYLAGHMMYNDLNDTDIQQFTGNMCAGIDLIQDTFPHIRIIVMSPTYAFAVNEDGEYVSSDQYRYGQDVLSTYVLKQCEYAYKRSVTFVDNLYGTINEDDAPQYLTDNIHLNAAGRKLVAERFAYALNYFDKDQEKE